MKHRVVVTRLGICSSLGSSVERFWSALCSGTSGVQFLEDMQSKLPVPGGRVMDLPPWEELKRRRYEPDRMIQLAHHAVAQVVNQEFAPLPQETGIFWGTGYTAMGTIESCYESWFLHDKVRADTVPACMPTSVLAHLATTFNLHGMSTLISASCASGMQAVGYAWHMLRHGVLQTALVGASDAPLTPGMYRAWKPLRVLASDYTHAADACRPFSSDRSGLTLAEGSAAFVLETLEHAQTHNHPIVAEIVGFHATTTPGSIVAPNVEHQAFTVQQALQSSNINATEIDYINAHATGTRVGDTAETDTIKAVWGEYAHTIPISAIKGATGHAMGASSALELLSTILTLRDQYIPPTINWQPGDPSCDLNYVPNQGRSAHVNLAIKESFGFGGANAAIILRRFVDDV